MKFEPLLPLWILLLVGLLIVVGIGWYVVMSLRKRPMPFRGVQLIRLVGIFACLVLIAAGPSVPGDRAPAGTVNLDVIIIVDRTPSISAEDYDGNRPRLEGVRSDLLQLTERLKGARIALVTFDSTVRISVPFTSDSSAVTTALRALDQQPSLYSKGSSIDLPIDKTVALLKQSKEKYPDRGRLIFYAGDGEQTDAKQPKSFANMKSLINGGAVLGYGTESGGKMKTYYGYQGVEYDGIGSKYVEDMTSLGPNGYSPAVSKIQESNLKAIASDFGVPYIHRTSLSEPLSTIVDASKLQVIGDSHRVILRYTSLYWIFSIIIIALITWWLIDLQRPLRVGLRKVGSV